MEQTSVETKAVVKKDFKITIFGSKSFSIFGLLEVVSASDNFVCVKLQNETLNIKGKNMSIKNLNLESSLLEVDGQVLETKFAGKAVKKPLIKRLFN